MGSAFTKTVIYQPVNPNFKTLNLLTYYKLYGFYRQFLKMRPNLKWELTKDLLKTIFKLSEAQASNVMMMFQTQSYLLYEI